jgi:uncharacterized membrane protein HdeD (DUF308 family)
MTTVTEERGPAAASSWWWLMLISGILWILLGFFVLEAHYDSAVLIGLLVAIWLIYAGVTEFLVAGVVGSWRWLHVVLGVLFLVGGIMALLSPFQTFTALAALIGFFLILFGAFEFAFAIAGRHEIEMWWLNLIAGILMVALGIWATGYPGRSAVLLLAWVGIGAIIRGTVQIVIAFRMRSAPEVVVAV